MKISHVIVDGSNIATEGRDAPSLAQLDEAVQAFIEEYSPDFVTVVVDATFPNRIDRKERQTYEDAVNANELITPPAGAIGRGDAFILQIARRAGASILSNDSFQEFHGEYPWLFEKGRLIGGKPVPHVGWVFMDRAPVRGPTSRRAVSEARKVAKAADRPATRASRREAGADEPATRAPRKRRTRAKAAAGPAAETVAETAADRPVADRSVADRAGDAVPAGANARAVAEAAAELSNDGRSGGSGRPPKGVDPYNEALPFIEFVAQHPVGTEVDAVIERFSSHGAYVMVGTARGYLPLRNLADPAPRSAKEVLRVGDEGRFVVVSIDPPRRGIDLAVPGVVDVPVAPAPAPAELEVAAAQARAADGATEAKPAARRGRGRKAAASSAPSPSVADEAVHTDNGDSADEGVSVRPGRTSATKPTGERAAGTKKAARSTTRKAAARKATAAPTEPSTTPTDSGGRPTDAATATDTGGQTTDTSAAADTAPAKKATARKTTAKKATSKKAAAKAPAKKATTKKAAAKKATAKKATATSPAARKAPAKRSTAKKAATTPAPSGRDDGGDAAAADGPLDASGG
jgi:hypothetical protein